MTDKHLEITAAYLFDNEADIMTVAKKFGVRHQEVSVILRRMGVNVEATRQQRLQGVYKKMRFLRSIGYSQARIAHETGYSVNNVRRIVGGKKASASDSR